MPTAEEVKEAIKAAKGETKLLGLIATIFRCQCCETIMTTRNFAGYIGCKGELVAICYDCQGAYT